MTRLVQRHASGQLDLLASSLLLVLLLLLFNDIGPRVVHRLEGGGRLAYTCTRVRRTRITYAMLEAVLALRLGEDTCADEDADGEALGPHTGLDDLLGHGLVAVGHDDGAGDAHGGGPGAEDDLVLVLEGPLLHALGAREALPVLLLLGLDALQLAHADARPCGLVELDAAALGLDGVRGEDDEDGGEGFELDGHRAEGGPPAVGDVARREGDGETGECAFDGAADGGPVVSLELLLGSDLEDPVSYELPRLAGGSVPSW